MKDVLDKAGYITAAEFQRTRKRPLLFVMAKSAPVPVVALSALVAAGVAAEVTQSGERAQLPDPANGSGAVRAASRPRLVMVVAVDLPRRVAAGGGLMVSAMVTAGDNSPPSYAWR